MLATIFRVISKTKKQIGIILLFQIHIFRLGAPQFLCVESCPWLQTNPFLVTPFCPRNPFLLSSPGRSWKTWSFCKPREASLRTASSMRSGGLGVWGWLVEHLPNPKETSWQDNLPLEIHGKEELNLKTVSEWWIDFNSCFCFKVQENGQPHLTREVSFLSISQATDVFPRWGRFLGCNKHWGRCLHSWEVGWTSGESESSPGPPSETATKMPCVLEFEK